MVIGLLVLLAGCAARQGLEQPHPPDQDRPGARGNPTQEEAGSNPDSTRLAGPSLWAEGRYVLKDREDTWLAVDSFRIKRLPDRGWKVESLQVGPGDREVMAWMELDQEYMPLRGEIVQQAYSSQCRIRFFQNGDKLTLMRKNGSQGWQRLSLEVEDPETFWVHMPAPPIYGLEATRGLPDGGTYRRLNTLACGLGAEQSVGWQAARLDDIEDSPTTRLDRSWPTLYLRHTLTPQTSDHPDRVSHLWVDPETGLLLEWIPSWEKGQRRWVLEDLSHRPDRPLSAEGGGPDSTESPPPDSINFPSDSLNSGEAPLVPVEPPELDRTSVDADTLEGSPSPSSSLW